MTAAVQRTYLPVLSPAPMRVAADTFPRSPDFRSQTPQSWSHRIHRLAPQQRPQCFSYCANGYAVVENTNGTLIDLYV